MDHNSNSLIETCVVFYSWQSDIRNVRNIIQKALASVDGRKSGLDVIIDHDTRGLSGSPRIEDAIIGKIRTCDLFVADVTIINSDYEGRKVCNPNVLLELGIAIASLGWDRIILLNCSDYGDIDDLPFDFNHNRIASFSVDKDGKEISRKKIASKILASLEILQSKGLIHGGNPVVFETKMNLHSILTRALANIVTSGPVVVLDRELERLDSIGNLLEPEYFDCLHRLLSTLILITKSPDDSENYFAQVKDTCIEPVYLEYRRYLPEFDVIDILREDIYNALNALLPSRKQKPFSHRRYKDDKLVFSSDPKNLVAYSSDGELLIEGHLNDNDYFCGFQIAKCGLGVYKGLFENGIRSGYGVEYVDFMSDEFKYPYCSGEWKNDELSDGTIYGYCSYLWWMNDIPEDGLPYQEFGCSSVLNGCVPDVEDGMCPVYDVEIKNGLGKCIADTLRRYPEEWFEKHSDILDMYLKNISPYNIPLNDISGLGDPVGINYDYILKRLNKRLFHRS